MSVTGTSVSALNDMSSMRETGMHDIPRPDTDYSFWDFVDIINPLQHIPGVSTLYREFTGDEISAPAKMIGGGIYGGFIGAALAAVDSVIEGTTGKDTGEHVMALFSDEEEAPEMPTAAAVADARDPAASAPVNSTKTNAAGSDSAEISPVLASTAPAEPQVDDQDLRWFPIQRGQDLRSFPATPRARGSAGAAPPAAVPRATPDDPAEPTASSTTQGAPLSLLSEKAWRAAPTADKEAIQRALAAQGIGATDHPMLNGAFAAQTMAAQQPRQAPSSGVPVTVPNWFDKAMMKALDSYERTGRLGAPEPRPHGA